MLAPFPSKVPEQTTASLLHICVELVKIYGFWRRSGVRKEVISHGAEEKHRVPQSQYHLELEHVVCSSRKIPLAGDWKISEGRRGVCVSLVEG